MKADYIVYLVGGQTLDLKGVTERNGYPLDSDADPAEMELDDAFLTFTTDEGFHVFIWKHVAGFSEIRRADSKDPIAAPRSVNRLRGGASIAKRR